MSSGILNPYAGAAATYKWKAYNGKIAIISFVVKFNGVNESSISKQKQVILHIFLVI